LGVPVVPLVQMRHAGSLDEMSGRRVGAPPEQN
jgi:hypothetical protein